MVAKINQPIEASINIPLYCTMLTFPRKWRIEDIRQRIRQLIDRIANIAFVMFVPLQRQKCSAFRISLTCEELYRELMQAHTRVASGKRDERA